VAQRTKTARTKVTAAHTLSLADQLFAITTRRNPAAAAEYLNPSRAAAIHEYRSNHSDALGRLNDVASAPAPKDGRRLFFTSWRNQSALITFARAAVFIAAVGSGITLVNYLTDDTISIEDEQGKSALNNEFGTTDKSVSLHLMRRRSKIGEFTVAQGSTLRVVKATNGDAFRSEVAFAGTEADFKLKYKGKASVIVNNGPFKAKVRIPHGKENDVHLRFKELGSPLPVGEPKFAIEVIKGNVQIAEVDDDDEFEHYKAGEKAVFSLADSESL
jgi:hypothetical protein